MICVPKSSSTSSKKDPMLKWRVDERHTCHSTPHVRLWWAHSLVTALSELVGESKLIWKGQTDRDQTCERELHNRLEGDLQQCKEGVDLVGLWKATKETNQRLVTLPLHLFSSCNHYLFVFLKKPSYYRIRICCIVMHEESIFSQILT